MIPCVKGRLFELKSRRRRLSCPPPSQIPPKEKNNKTSQKNKRIKD